MQVSEEANKLQECLLIKKKESNQTECKKAINQQARKECDKVSKRNARKLANTM